MRKFIYLFVALGMLSLTACDKKKSNNNNNAYGPNSCAAQSRPYQFINGQCIAVDSATGVDLLKLSV